MELDIKPRDLEELKPIVRGKLNDFTATDQGRIQQFEKTEQLESEYKNLEGKMGWREKNLAGYLGGNRELVKEWNLKNEELKKTRERLRSIENQLNEQSINLNDEIKKFLSEKSDNFSNLQNELRLQSKLLKASKQYESLLRQARQGVIDALVWADWETLINHRDAKRELVRFKKETDKFQKSIESYEANSNGKIGEPVQLNDLIRFSNQQVAMNSFKKLLSQAVKYKKHTTNVLGEIKQQANGIVDSVRETAEGK